MYIKLSQRFFTPRSRYGQRSLPLKRSTRCNYTAFRNGVTLFFPAAARFPLTTRPGETGRNETKGGYGWTETQIVGLDGSGKRSRYWSIFSFHHPDTRRRQETERRPVTILDLREPFNRVTGWQPANKNRARRERGERWKGGKK